MTATNLILSGGVSHDFATTSAFLADLFDGIGIASAVYEDLDEGFDSLAAGGVDLLTVNCLRWQMGADRFAPRREEHSYRVPPQARATVLDHVENGGGVLALHTATICFDDWPEWGSLIGGAWNWERSGHPPLGIVHVSVPRNTHTIVAGLGDFEVEDEVYSDLDLQLDVDPLAEAPASSNGIPRAQPLLWATDVGDGRVVYDALGHGTASMGEPTHATILCRSALWAMHVADDEIRDAVPAPVPCRDSGGTT